MKITKPQQQLGAPVRVPGQYYIVSGRNGLIVKKWPRKRGRNSSAAQTYKEWEFGLAAREASSPDGGLLGAAISYADGSLMLPRDFLIQSAYGTHTRIYFEDGSEWTRYRDVTINGQLVLDQVSDTVGAMMYRAPVGWVEVSPGINGSFLYFNNLVPQWLPSAPPAGAIPTAGMYGLLNPAANATILPNVLGGTAAILTAGTIVNALNMYITLANGTSKVAPVIYTRTGNQPGALAQSGPQVTGVTVGINRFPFTTPYLVLTTDLYYLGISNTVANLNQANTNATVYGWQRNSAFPPPNPAGVVTHSFVSTVPKVWID